MPEKLPPRIELPLLDDAASALREVETGDERVFTAELDGPQVATIMKAVVAQLVERKIPLSSVKQEMTVDIGENSASFSGDAEIFVGLGIVKKSMAKVGLSFAMENDPEGTRLHDGDGQIKLAGTGTDDGGNGITFTHLELSGAADGIIRAAKLGPEGTSSTNVVKGLVINKLRDPNQAFLDVLRGQMATRGSELSTLGLSFGKSTTPGKEGTPVLNIRATARKATRAAA